MTEEEVLDLQDKLIEKEKELLERSMQIEKTKLNNEVVLEAEWEKLRTQQPSCEPNTVMMFQAMQDQILKLTTLYQNAIEMKNDPEIKTENNNTINLGSRDRTIGLKEALNTIPNFNGYDISVFHFSQTYERARDMLPRNLEFSLVQLIIGKLKGHASQIIHDQNFKAVDDLTRQLKNIFAPHKTVNQYRSVLGNIYQHPNESILEYFGRINDLKAALLDCEKQLYDGDLPEKILTETK